MKPSSHENGRIVENFYRKLLAGDLQAVKAYLDPDTRQIADAAGL
jgi:ketosteroid isomerase-like protein